MPCPSPPIKSVGPIQVGPGRTFSFFFYTFHVYLKKFWTNLYSTSAKYIRIGLGRASGFLLLNASSAHLLIDSNFKVQARRKTSGRPSLWTRLRTSLTAGVWESRRRIQILTCCSFPKLELFFFFPFLIEREERNPVDSATSVSAEREGKRKAQEKEASAPCDRDFLRRSQRPSIFLPSNAANLNTFAFWSSFRAQENLQFRLSSKKTPGFEFFFGGFRKKIPAFDHVTATMAGSRTKFDQTLGFLRGFGGETSQISHIYL